MGARERTCRYRQHIAEMSDDELENETYTLRHERRYLTDLSDDDAAERLSLCEFEATRRLAGRFAS